METSCSSDYSIVKGVEKVFAKTQAQLRWKRHAKNRAEKRKHDEDSKSDDDLVRIELVQSGKD